MNKDEIRAKLNQAIANRSNMTPEEWQSARTDILVDILLNPTPEGIIYLNDGGNGSSVHIIEKLGARSSTDRVVERILSRRGKEAADDYQSQVVDLPNRFPGIIIIPR